MRRLFTSAALLLATMAVVTAGVSQRAVADPPDPRLITTTDPTGLLQTFSPAGPVDTTNPFFQDLGTNGRTCVTCHVAATGWSIAPPEIRHRFATTAGLDPLFRNNDGSNCEGADLSTLAARRHAFSLLLRRGLIRVGLDVPLGAEFRIVDVDDPYACHAGLLGASLYRRPLPSTNLAFLSGVMWDGRESPLPAGPIAVDLANQARDATTGHAQATLPPTDAQVQAIVNFELGLFTAQAYDREAGNLATGGATGGPVALSSQPFFIGINDPLGQNPTGAPFDPRAFTLFNAWAAAKGGDRAADRRAVARGQELFNTKPIAIVGVRGLNDELGAPSIGGTCTTCHDTPNVGNHSVKAPLDLGLTDSSRRTPDMPLYTLQNLATGETRQTTDPGRAMITGKWKDVGRFKGPILHGLAARAPYFHNGFADSLEAVVDFYNTRFGIGLTRREREDLVAFLRTL